MPSQLSANPGGAPFGLFTQSTTLDINLGSKFVDQSGNTYAFAQAGATALVAGTLLQAPAEDTAHQNIAPTATFAIGATSVSLTLGASAATANQYAGGWLVTTETPGEGYKYLISGHAAVDASGVITLTLVDPLQVALTTSSHADLVANPFKGVIINPSTATSCPVGVATDIIAISGYGWIQTGGIAAVLADGTVTVGTSVVASNATAGAVEAATGVQALVGTAVTGIATTEFGAIKLDLQS
jgi:hypothetical protein